MSIHIIYIPGLGDNYDSFRRFGLRIWSLFGVSTELVPMTWYDGGSFADKYPYIEASIAAAHDRNTTIVLVGESAGATMALVAAAKNSEVAHVVTLCGVAQPHTPIAQSLRRRAPALDEAVGKLANLTSRPELKRTSLRAVIDRTVGKRYSIARGATEHVVWSVGHIITIMLCLTFFSPYMTRLTKRI